MTDGDGYNRKADVLRALQENRNDYAEHLQRQMGELISEEMSRLRVDLMRNLPSMIRRECRKVLTRALAPGKPTAKKKKRKP